MLRRASYNSKKQRPSRRISWFCADAKSLPFGDESFDVVTAHSFLYLIDDPKALLREAARVLTEQGLCVFFEPSEKVGLGAVKPALTSLRFGLSMIGWRMMSRINGRFTRETLTTLFGQSGYNVINVDRTLFGMGLTIVAKKKPH
jgi:ubiquinone/menaquinone biosynthesis C-methylase UbiE